MKTLLAATTIAATLATGMGTAAAAPASVDSANRFHSQRLNWKPCDDARLDAAGASCADVTVPLDYAKPDGRTITVAISRIKATDTRNRRGIMLSNPGGPGGPGLDFALDFRDALAPDVRGRYDQIGMDPRGVGRSTPVDCKWPVATMLRSAGLDRAAFTETARLETDLARRCRDTVGSAYLRHITTRNTVRDMDVIRAALGEKKISYFGVSYGTYLGAVFTQMFPNRTDRIVLDSAADPARWGVATFQAMGPANEAAFDDWAAWVAARDGEYHLGGTAHEVRARFQGLVARAARQPIKVGAYAVDEHMLPMVPYVLFDDHRNNGTLAEVVRQLTDAADGKAVRPHPALEGVFLNLTSSDPTRQNSAQTAVICGDAAMPRDPQWYWRNIQRSRTTQPLFGPVANNILPCAAWAPPAEPTTVVRNSVPALIVQSTGDTRTTYAGAVDLHRAMTGSKLVTLKDTRVHWVFGRYPNTCVENSVNTYFRDGTLPAADRACR
ncbi:alpha/beta fold hydrolase [Actinokineospora auranticolor]|uniref:Alpha/beta hydrolase family protein n=1 Tax=Actinokineospora auranticolor TaxID=155976 RepID=A0A2S6GMR9_9PSEU|nr:alpha/beta hydrolase [Actinokineospora auranticolor]PPK66525.1 alpha/beta hydrolase family protein [Actinokineospora auranticolor]